MHVYVYSSWIEENAIKMIEESDPCTHLVHDTSGKR